MKVAHLKFLDNKLGVEKEYWLQKLSGDLAMTSLPCDLRRPKIFDHTKETIGFEISPDTVDRLFAICAHSESLIFAALVTALNVCLHKYTGNTDIIIYTTIHERHGGVASLNRILALRNQVTTDMTVRQLLVNVKNTLSEAYANQKYPFENILNLLNIERPDNRSPLSNLLVMLDNINNPENAWQLKNDVTLLFSRSDRRLTGSIKFNPSLFKRTSLEIFRVHYESVLRKVLDEPEAHLSELDWLSPAKRHELVFAFNNTAANYPKHKTIHQLFEEQAERTPENVAVAFQDRTLSYRELNSRANQLAQHLQRLGIKPGVLVGLYLRHSTEMLVALLAVLKAGGAYVPLDPSNPSSQLDFMLKDAQVQLVLTESEMLNRLPSEAITTLCLNDFGEKAERDSEANVTAKTTAEDLAYVIYTSGSTGQPKGVKIQHRALVNYICWARDVYLQNENLSFALYSSLAFDLTVTSIFTPLITGNSVIIYRQRGKEIQLREILQNERVGVLKLTPSHLSLIKDENNRHSGIKRLIVGGEAFESELAQQTLDSFGGGVEIFNEYGPTEATVGCMLHKFDPQKDDRASVPIGVPAANSKIYILDEELQPVPENVIGELYISGEGLAQGYLNRPDLTEERFLENPFVAGQRMYKTGDLARWLPEREIEYAGRRDEQVKYHGYRVELQAIRSALNSHSQVRDSVVMLRKDQDERDVLVAYYVSRNEIEVGELRAFLSDRIIEETIPNLFVHLKKLPLTLNGKINSRALPTLEQAREQSKRGYVAPRDETEQLLAGIWATVLSVKDVGREDNFFEIGGHSLLAAQVSSRVRETFKVEMPFQDLFESSTLAALAERIKTAISSKENGPAPPIDVISRDQELPLSFAQRRFWFLSHSEPKNPSYNLHAPLRLTGELNAAALEQTINEIVRRHEILRTIFPAADGRPVQLILDTPMLVMSHVDLSGLPQSKLESEVQKLITQETEQLFDLSKGPLLRVSLKRLSAREHAVQLTMHHIISDGWSLEILNQEVATIYRAFSSGKPSPLAELPIQYADFAAWQRQRLQGELRQTQLSYWKQQLKDATPVLESLTDYPRPRLRTYKATTKFFEFSSSLTESLKEFSLQHKATLFMLLLSASKVLLYRYSGQEDIVVGTPFANRSRSETEHLIGCLINSVVLRTNLSANPTFAEVLSRVRDVTLAAQAHQDVPFELVVETLQPERRTNYTPLFQVWFVWYQRTMPVIEQHGLQLSPVEIKTEAAQFDLTLSMSEVEGEIKAGFIYSTELFKEVTIKQMIEHYTQLLEKGITHTQCGILDIPLDHEEQALESQMLASGAPV